MEALNEQGKSIKGANILILGLAYKKDVDDMRESPSLKLLELFREKGAQVDYNDPHIPVMPKLRHHRFDLRSVELKEEVVATYDAVVIATDHSVYDYEWLRCRAKLINALGTRNGDTKVVEA